MIYLAKISVNKKGFSFMELMVVLAIVGILAAVAMPAYFNHMSRSRQSKAIGELMSIKAAQERYFAENGQYTGSLGNLDSYNVAGTMTIQQYQYLIISAAGTGFIPSGTIQAKGDLNGDGAYTNIWEVPIDDLAAKPTEAAVGNEGFSWSSMAEIFR